MMCQVWSKKKTTTKQNPKKAAFFFALLLQILELMHNRITLYHMAKTGEKACVLEINFTNEKKKKRKNGVEDANKIVEKTLKEI